MHKVIRDQVLMNRVSAMKLRLKGYPVMRYDEYRAVIEQKDKDIGVLTSMADTLTKKIAWYEDALRRSNDDLVKALERMDRAGLIGRDL